MPQSDLYQMFYDLTFNSHRKMAKTPKLEPIPGNEELKQVAGSSDNSGKTDTPQQKILGIHSDALAVSVRLANANKSEFAYLYESQLSAKQVQDLKEAGVSVILSRGVYKILIQ